MSVQSRVHKRHQMRVVGKGMAKRFRNTARTKNVDKNVDLAQLKGSKPVAIVVNQYMLGYSYLGEGQL